MTSPPMVPSMGGIALEPSNLEGNSLSPAAQDIIREKVGNLRSSPSWVKALQLKTLNSYFKSKIRREGPLPERESEQLIRDASALSEYFEQDDKTKEFKSVPEYGIKPFIRSLTFAKLNARLRGGKVTQAIGNWTVESLVVRMHLASLAKFPDRAKRALNMISGRHLKGASKAALALSMGGGAFYMFSDVGGSWVAFTIMATVVGAFKAGPLATIMNAGTSWFINPTVEYVKVINNRYTAPIETRINNFFDRMKPTSESEEEDSKANTTPKIGDINEDAMDFGGMSETEQRENWTKLLRVWVGVCKHYYKLLRDTHHLGRSLVLNSWNDEMSATLFMETMDSKLAVLSVEELQLLSPYQTGFIVRGDNESKDRLDQLFDHYRDLCARTWMESLSEGEAAQLGKEIRNTQSEIQAMGLSDLVMQKLWDVQVRRAHAVSALTTGLAMNELKLLSNAEANRNLQAEAREAQRALHRGFGVQRFVETYGLKITETHRKMGFENSGAKAGPSCETLLEKAVRDATVTGNLLQ